MIPFYCLYVHVFFGGGANNNKKNPKANLTGELPVISRLYPIACRPAALAACSDSHFKEMEHTGSAEYTDSEQTLIKRMAEFEQPRYVTIYVHKLQ